MASGRLPRLGSEAACRPNDAPIELEAHLDVVGEDESPRSASQIAPGGLGTGKAPDGPSARSLSDAAWGLVRGNKDVAALDPLIRFGGVGEGRSPSRPDNRACLHRPFWRRRADGAQRPRPLRGRSPLWNGLRALFS
jgi:hypothetical protein